MANEKRLIDAMQAVTKMSGRIVPMIRMGENPMQVYNEVLQVLAEAPTVDAVEVVRCKDCESHSSNGCPDHRVWCRRLCRYMDSDGFCSDGERREGE